MHRRLTAGVAGERIAKDQARACQPAATPERARILFFTCAGGPGGTYEEIGQREEFLPTSIRNRLLRRALSFQPDAAVANGDHIYSDLHYWQGETAGQLTEAGRIANFDHSASALGGSNEAAIKAAAGPNAVFVDHQVERWLTDRTRSTEVRHLVHAPSNLIGWSAGKWGEWYPDILDPESGVLSGPIGSVERGFPSVIRRIPATPPAHLDLEEMAPPIEDHGFTLVDFLSDRIVLRHFAWDVNREPIYTTELERPG